MDYNSNAMLEALKQKKARGLDLSILVGGAEPLSPENEMANHAKDLKEQGEEHEANKELDKMGLAPTGDKANQKAQVLEEAHEGEYQRPMEEEKEESGGLDKIASMLAKHGMARNSVSGKHEAMRKMAKNGQPKR